MVGALRTSDGGIISFQMLVKGFVRSLAVGRVARGILPICVLGCVMVRAALPSLGLSATGQPTLWGMSCQGSHSPWAGLALNESL